MPEFIIDGSHFSGVLRAVAWIQEHKYTGSVELVCDDEAEVYILRAEDTVKTLTELPY